MNHKSSIFSDNGKPNTIDLIAAIQAASRQRADGIYWIDTWGGDSGWLRWHGDGEAQPESVGAVHFDECLVQLVATEIEHPELIDHLEGIGYTVAAVDGIVWRGLGLAGGQR